ncbi:acyl-CoA dehydrogenase family protein [Aromatoleum petrolei]|uniref:Pimeloyl-CoA dehydrogenase small subunit n=1 Tax=Aromatoleum petrolei TaxID=76116 RepID=A0ABX1MR37_9RHOO|nr:acyl-CoA dehydrogenase family protein [Aromatoleum petrolei]NMF88574.1 pimeloyl-CoA dehydrogenase small subunit [Aromatoleum petrolei]QTQ34718.1 Putative acyl-CoA dehydrogenase/oxidase [Aromatoleum petrolei]
MDFNYSEEQQMLTDTIGRFVEKTYDFESRRKLAKTELGFSREHWSTLAEMGLMALVVPEEFGGMGGSPVETLIVMEAFGRGLVLEPYVGTAVVAANLITEAGNVAQKEAMLGAIADGSRRFALAALEPQGRFDLWDVATRATSDGAGYVLDGRKAVVLGGDSADTLIISARTSGRTTDRVGISLFLVDAKAPGLTIEGFPNLDGQRSAEVTLSNVRVGSEALLGARDAGYPSLEWAVDHGIAALCAEAVGVMSKLLDTTAEYLRTRKQFGKPIGSFQALQHAAADMLTALEQCRSAAVMAAAKVDSADAAERRAAISAAKTIVGQAGRAIGKHAVQLHGGMGMTDELAVGHYFKRLLCIDMTWGDSDHHIEQYAALL